MIVTQYKIEIQRTKSIENYKENIARLVSFKHCTNK